MMVHKTIMPQDLMAIKKTLNTVWDTDVYHQPTCSQNGAIGSIVDL